MAKKLTSTKAKKILHDKEVHGHPLTEQQRKFFGAIAGGAKPYKAESGGWLDKFDAPQAQNGFIGPIENKDAETEFIESWMSSPRYAEMLKRSSGSTDEYNIINQGRLENIRRPYTKSEISPDDILNEGNIASANVLFSKKEYASPFRPGSVDRPSEAIGYDVRYNPKSFDQLSPLGRMSMLIHERSHTSDMSFDDAYNPDKNLLPLKDKELIGSRESLTGYHRYLKQPSEIRARLNELRFLGKESGVYDPFTEAIDLEKLKQLDKKTQSMGLGIRISPYADLEEIYTPEQIVELLNSVSKTSTKESPKAQVGTLITGTSDLISPVYDIFSKIRNLGTSDYSDKKDFDAAYSAAKKAGEEEFVWNSKRYNTKYAGTPRQEVGTYGVQGKPVDLTGLRSDPSRVNLYPMFGKYLPGHLEASIVDGDGYASINYSSAGNRPWLDVIKPEKGEKAYYVYGANRGKFSEKATSLPLGMYSYIYDGVDNRPSDWELFTNNCADNVCDAFGIPRSRGLQTPKGAIEKIKKAYPTLDVTGRTKDDYDKFIRESKQNSLTKERSKDVLSNADRLLNIYYSPDTPSSSKKDIGYALQRSLINQGYELPKSKTKLSELDTIVGDETLGAIKNWKSKNKKQDGGAIEGTMGGLTDKGFNYNGAWGGPSMQVGGNIQPAMAGANQTVPMAQLGDSVKPIPMQLAMGGSLPGAVGFTYARTAGAAPANGPYAKKTKASAQNGQEMKFYQEGLDFTPKTISKNGGWLNKYDVPQAQTGKMLEYLKSKKTAPVVTKGEPMSEEMQKRVTAETLRRQTQKNKPLTATNTREQAVERGRAENLRVIEENKEYDRQAMAEGKAAEATRENPNVPFTFPTGESKLWKDMDRREQQYVSGRNLGSMSRSNNWTDWINPITMIGEMGEGLATAPYMARETDSNLPYAVGIGSPLLTGALGGAGTKGTKKTNSLFGKSKEFPKRAFQYGGDIPVDPMGYWNPDNVGSPVIIPSTDITMEGVDQPLVGVSDTGDVQYMMPGEDYEFDGEYVTEYPVAQEGYSLPTAKDSLNLYNRSLQVQDYYGKRGYIKKPTIPSPSEIISGHNSFVDYLERLRKKGNPNAAKDIALEKKLLPKKLAEAKEYQRNARAKSFPNYKEELKRSREEFAEVNVLGTEHRTRAGTVENGPISFSQYYRKTDPNQFEQRERSFGFLDLNSPMQLYDERIVPQHYFVYHSPLGKNIRYDAVEMYAYDPLAIKPYAMRTAQEKVEWERKYGQSNRRPKIETSAATTTPTTTKAPVRTINAPSGTKGIFGPNRQRIGEYDADTNTFYADYEGVYGKTSDTGRAAQEFIRNREQLEQYIFERTGKKPNVKSLSGEEKKQRNGGVNNADAQPLKKLDQLLNFTNYNKPTKGGWLDKYN
jgi:hypothetical protein